MKQRHNGDAARHVGERRARRGLFGSVFAKYITAFVLIILACFLMLAAIITGVVRSYALSSRENLVSSTADRTEAYVEARMAETDISQLSDFVEGYGADLSSIFKIVCGSAADDTTIFLTDGEGNVIFFVSREENEAAIGRQIPLDLLGQVLSGFDHLQVSDVDGLLPEPHLVKALPIESGGAVSGTLFVCSSSASLDDLLGVVMKTLVLLGIWVVLAALVAVYLLTEKITGPLRAMSRAARSFARGNFEVQIPVRGSDEVAELAMAFNQMSVALKNLEKMRTTFMANVSHDLRTPMTTIAGFIDSILAGAIPPEKQPHYLELVSGEVKRLSRLVSLTLDVSRIQAGDRKFSFKQFDICEMARQILISFEQKIDAKHLEVEFDVDDDKMTVYADHDAIYQILYNICDNAVKFSREGGRLSLAIRSQREKKVLVTVFNEGQGIPEEDIPYVFDQFYKGDKSRGLDKTGVGLGMYISKTIIDAHHEEIWVHSEFGKNCEFGFSLSTKPVVEKNGDFLT